MTPKRHSCGGLHRRAFLASAALVPALEGVRFVSAAGPRDAADPRDLAGKLGIPGPYPGRVIEVKNPAMIRDGVRNRAAVRRTVERGMKELTGADDAVGAWRRFFEPGDVVGIKVVPNGHPAASTSPELVLEVIEGLKSAGVKPRDMFVYDRYLGEFTGPGYHKALPDGVRWGGLTPDGSPQTELTFAAARDDPVAGYDRDEFVFMDLIHHGEDPKDDRNFRSHLGLLITKRVNKLVMLPCLKDHGSAGVTGALKNISHGSVNNVARSHATPETNVCCQFIPEVVNHPVLRKKCVLHIMDAIRGVFHGGPFGGDPRLSWDHGALLFATDPVAMDRVEWTIIDAKRKEQELPPVAASGRVALDPRRSEGFDIRQPQHIILAGNLGLGLSEFKSPKGRRHSIDHRVIPVA
jgi:uncharacterized protein (DUF362 family)